MNEKVRLVIDVLEEQHKDIIERISVLEDKQNDNDTVLDNILVDLKFKGYSIDGDTSKNVYQIRDEMYIGNMAITEVAYSCPNCNNVTFKGSNYCQQCGVKLVFAVDNNE